MSGLNKQNIVEIEKYLFSAVRLLLEGQYNIEGVINPDNKDSTKIILKNKKEAIKIISKEIRKFSLERNIPVNDVKDYLIQIIEEKLKLANECQQEYETLKEAVITENNEDTREI